MFAYLVGCGNPGAEILGHSAQADGLPRAHYALRVQAGLSPSQVWGSGQNAGGPVSWIFFIFLGGDSKVGDECRDCGGEESSGLDCWETLCPTPLFCPTPHPFQIQRAVGAPSRDVGLVDQAVWFELCINYCWRRLS